MNTSAKFLTAAGALALGLSMNVTDAQAGNGKEKCYGVVKAGKNDCGAADGSHGCAGAAKTDNSPSEWIFLPEGTCERLGGGSLEGK